MRSADRLCADMRETIQRSHRLTIARLLPLVIGAILAAPADGQLPLGSGREAPAVEVAVEPVVLPSNGSVGSVPVRPRRLEYTAPLVEPDRSRGEVAVRGAFWGAVVGGLLGYNMESDSDRLMTLLRGLGGAVIGAPIGMVVFLLATPF